MSAFLGSMNPHPLLPALVLLIFTPNPARTAPVALVEESPASVSTVAPGVILLDFGRVAFGNLQFVAPAGAAGVVTVHFGEAFSGGRVDRTPPGSVRYARAAAVLSGEATPLVVAPAADRRNTSQPMAVLTPREWGVVTPFRWVEIEGWPGEPRPESFKRRAAFSAAWDDAAASFRSSDEMLDRVWELCRYSIKATTFAGVYVDGDRERIPYEGDAYLNQLSHYAATGETEMARDTFDRLMKHPTWPTEWATHLVFMAHADWMRTGDTRWLAARYDSLKPKLKLANDRGDGLIETPSAHLKNDLVDWPGGERDGFVFKPVNTVINAFHLRALRCMADLARALGRESDALDYEARETVGRAVFNRMLFDPERGLYRDGDGTDHVSLHANLFPLAFGLAPPEKRARITEWLGKRGMACSVYAAQYLMEGLFQNDAGATALELMLAPNQRSWRHMVESGTTITWEAWDQRFKPNQDWNHAWGAAPANLLPRFVLGAEPLAPGWARIAIRPNPGRLRFAEGKIPTPHGPLNVRWSNADAFKLSLALPAGVAAQIRIPAGPASTGVWLDGAPVAARRDGTWWVLENDATGTVTIETR